MTDDSRKEALKKALEKDQPQKQSRLESGPTVGKGRLRTRVNWGFWVLLGAFALFIVTWFILRPMGVFG